MDVVDKLFEKLTRNQMKITFFLFALKKGNAPALHNEKANTQ